VAGERLEDGSGLELLGQISKKWPSVLRIFAADRQRLQLLRGRLGPFELFQTLTYPIDPERLIATLDLAAAAQNADADTSDIQHVELTGEPPAEASDVAEEPADLADSLESEESEDFPAPQPAPRVAPMEHAQAASHGGRVAHRGNPAHRTRPAPVGRPRRNGAGGAPTTRGNSGPSGAPSARGLSSGQSGARGGAPAQSRTAAGPSAARDTASNSISPGAPRPGRSRGATNKAPPVRFPPLERVPPLERIPPLEPAENSSGRRSSASHTESFAEAAAMARSARSNYESNSEELDTKRLAMMVGGGIAVVLVVVFLGFKMFGSKSEAPRVAAPAVAHAPEYPQEVTDLIAQTEEAFKADDFKAARADVDKLRQLSPSHPRLSFFEGILTALADGSKSGSSSASTARGASKKNGQPSRRNGSGSTSDATIVAGTDGSARSGSATSPTSTAATKHAVTDVTSASATSGTGSPADGSSRDFPALAPETLAGFSRATAASDEPPHTDAAGSTPASAAMSVAGATSVPGAAVSAPAAASASAAASTLGAGSASGVASVAVPAAAMTAAANVPPTAATAPVTTPAAAATQSSTSSSTRRASGEPPPVIQEAKLIRRVNPDYPSAAKKDGIAGSVDLDVTVSTQGVVEDASVVKATPPDIFEKSALAAVRKWKYDPRFVDGLPSQAHLKVHLEFGPNK
jgi:TonB family protein